MAFLSWRGFTRYAGHTVTRDAYLRAAGKVRQATGPVLIHTIGEIIKTDDKNSWLLYGLEKQACAGDPRGVRAQDGR